MKTIDDAGGMYKAVESGLVQRMIGDSALRFQQRIERGEQTIVGVNAYRADEDAAQRGRRSSGPTRRRCSATSTRSRPGRRRARRRRSTRRSTARRAPPKTHDGNVFGAVVDGGARRPHATGRSAAGCAATSASASRWSSSDAWPLTHSPRRGARPSARSPATGARSRAC